MCSKRAFNEERPDEGLEEVRRTGNADISITEAINLIYKELAGYGFLYKDLYDTDINELTNTLEAKKKQLAYEMWKQAGLIAMACFNKKYPENPEKASPELFPPKKKYKLPDFLKKD